MITDVYVVYNNENQVKKVEDSCNKESLTFHFIDSQSIKTKREAFMLKSHWAARLDPFALVTDGDKAIKAFYSEAENVIDSLIKYLNE